MIIVLHYTDTRQSETGVIILSSCKIIRKHTRQYAHNVNNLFKSISVSDRAIILF